MRRRKSIEIHGCSTGRGPSPRRDAGWSRLQAAKKLFPQHAIKGPP